MTDKPKDGGPAFPRTGGIVRGPNEDEWVVPQRGMSLRDWFAGMAVRARWGNGEAMTTEDAARMAYQLADAMLAEGEKVK